MRTEQPVRDCLHERLGDVVANSKIIIAVTRNLGFFTNGYSYLTQLIPLVLVAPLYMRAEVEFGVVTQSAMAFSQFLGAFSLIITQFETISSFAAVTDRLNRISEGIDQAQVRAPTNHRGGGGRHARGLRRAECMGGQRAATPHARLDIGDPSRHQLAGDRFGRGCQNGPFPGNCRAMGERVSVPVRKGTTLGGQWVPAERLRRDPFDHSHQGLSQLAGLARGRAVAVGRGDRPAEVVGMCH